MILYGESYGTQYAQTYAAAHPERLQGVIVDGVVDLTRSGPAFWRSAAHHVMSPPFRAPEHQDALWGALQGGTIEVIGTDHCTFRTEQKAMGKDDFRKIPNGTGGLEERMSVLWHHGVRTGRLTAEEFVGATSANAATVRPAHRRPRQPLVSRACSSSAYANHVVRLHTCRGSHDQYECHACLL